MNDIDAADGTHINYATRLIRINTHADTSLGAVDVETDNELFAATSTLVADATGQNIFTAMCEDCARTFHCHLTLFKK